MIKRDFDRGLKENDFTVGDTFWLNGICFEVIDKDLKNIEVGKDE